MRKKPTERVLAALVKAIEEEPRPELVTEFRALLPATVETDRVKKLEEAFAALAERFEKIESDQAEIVRDLETLMAVNGVRKPDVADVFEKF